MVQSPWPQPSSRTREPGGMEKKDRRSRRYCMAEGPPSMKILARSWAAGVGVGGVEGMVAVGGLGCGIRGGVVLELGWRGVGELIVLVLRF